MTTSSPFEQIRESDPASDARRERAQAGRSSVRAAISWSGGKDSCLAFIRAAESGLRPDLLLTMTEPDGTSKSHALPQALLEAQANALDIPSRFVRSAFDDYGSIFDATLRALRQSGTTHLVFGDIDLQAHRDWLEHACGSVGVDAVFPLWGLSRQAVADEVIERGIHAVTVCVDTRWLDASFCGASYDKAFLARLPAGVCPCGEDGEFHTVVWDAPCFSRPLRLSIGPQRRVRSSPPYAPTEWVFQTLGLLPAGA